MPIGEPTMPTGKENIDQSRRKFLQDAVMLGVAGTLGVAESADASGHKTAEPKEEAAVLSDKVREQGELIYSIREKNKKIRENEGMIETLKTIDSEEKAKALDPKAKMLFFSIPVVAALTGAAIAPLNGKENIVKKALGGAVVGAAGGSLSMAAGLDKLKKRQEQREAEVHVTLGDVKDRIVSLQGENERLKKEIDLLLEN